MNPPESPTPEARCLARLIAIKRLELPPPGFFDRLPHRILVNLRAGTVVAEGPWWERAWTALAREPMAACSYAALGLGAVAFGVSVLLTALDGPAPSSGIAFTQLPTAEWAVSPVTLAPGGSLAPGVIYRVPSDSLLPWQHSFASPIQPSDRFPIANRAEILPVFVVQPR